MVVEEMGRRLWPRRGRGVDLVLGPKGEGGLDFRGSDEACMGAKHTAVLRTALSLMLGRS